MSTWHSQQAAVRYLRSIIRFEGKRIKTLKNRCVARDPSTPRKGGTLDTIILFEAAASLSISHTVCLSPYQIAFILYLKHKEIVAFLKTVELPVLRYYYPINDYLVLLGYVSFMHTVFPRP